jgi:DNA modification methylase
MDGANAQAALLLRAMRSFLGENDMMAYLAMMAIRLIELHRVLKPTGSLYLHCDPTASHYLKLLLDGVFGPPNYRNEIVWKRTHAHGSARRYGPIHDSIHFVSKSDEFIWMSPRVEHDKAYVEKHFRYEDATSGRRFQAISLTGAGVRRGESGKPWRGVDPTLVNRHWALPRAVLDSVGISEGTVQDKLDALDKAGLIFWPTKSGGTPRLKHFADALAGASTSDIWTDIAPLGAQAQERLGYPTQKPLKLLERIVAASSRPGDLVLDPFCGCGTAVHAAHKLERRWVGIDVTCLAISSSGA